jgi:mRNA interferase MazF
VVSRGEVRWAQIGDKQRPVVVLTRDPVADRIERVTVAPCTTTIRGLRSEVVLEIADGVPQRCVVSLDNVQPLRHSALGVVMARLDDEVMERVCSAVSYAYGCDMT